jgi:hypothetical protein
LRKTVFYHCALLIVLLFSISVFGVGSQAKKESIVHADKVIVFKAKRELQLLKRMEKFCEAIKLRSVPSQSAPRRSRVTLALRKGATSSIFVMPEASSSSPSTFRIPTPPTARKLVSAAFLPAAAS